MRGIAARQLNARLDAGCIVVLDEEATQTKQERRRRRFRPALPTLRRAGRDVGAASCDCRALMALPRTRFTLRCAADGLFDGRVGNSQDRKGRFGNQCDGKAEGVTLFGIGRFSLVMVRWRCYSEAPSPSGWTSLG